MFWHDIASIEQETVSHSCVDSLGNHMVNNVGYQMQSHLATNQVDCQLDPHSMANHVDYQLEPHEQLSVDDYLLQSQLGGPDQINNQLWVHDQSYDVFTSSEAINGTLTQPNLGIS
uniref:NAC domain-containing protein 69 isoform X2 n=1 Tax=Rhizophora mucronata TaxID=61149 RepID=A0A2P2J8Z0_RHIMU